MVFDQNAYGNPKAKNHGVSPTSSGITIDPRWSGFLRGHESQESSQQSANGGVIVAQQNEQNGHAQQKPIVSEIYISNHDTSIPAIPAKCAAPTSSQVSSQYDSSAASYGSAVTTPTKPKNAPLLVNTLKQNHNIRTSDPPMFKADLQPKPATATPSIVGTARKTSNAAAPTYETVKQGAETPQQLIARLQADGSRKAHQRIRLKDTGEIRSTTALEMLDKLRETQSVDAPLLAQIVNPDESMSFAESPQALTSSRTKKKAEPKPKPKPRESRWCKNSDLKAPPRKPDSNAEGSVPESDIESNPDKPNDFGRLLRRHKPETKEEPLAGWDGQFAPAPAEWEHRPQFYNNTAEYISGFENWLGEVTVRTMSDKSAPDFNFDVLPVEQVADPNMHPDGIGLVSRETVLHPSNAARYGHRLVQAIRGDPENPLDFDSDAKIDLRDCDSARHRNETADIFIKRRIEQIARAQHETEEQKKRQEQADLELAQQLAAAAVTSGDVDIYQEQYVQEPPKPMTTKNIYLRPAVDADIPNLTKLFNWHVQNNVRPVELKDLPEEDMRLRLESSQHNRLPFIVAVERTRHNAGSKSRRYPRVSPNHPIQNIDPNYQGVKRDEPIVGFASATDWSAIDYIDVITTELELYVAASHRQSGVGSCLLDALLDATDRGYFKKGGYELRVAPECRHMYTNGGVRDIHKLVFQIRSYSRPFTPKQQAQMIRAAMGNPDPPTNVDPKKWREQNSSWYTTFENDRDAKDSKEAKIADREDDYSIWLKQWLESHGFWEEAKMTKLGAKNGRFVDVAYMTRETAWLPADGRIPDFSNGF